jgi:alpha-tubulin suppressor-like RCC1 family protein
VALTGVTQIDAFNNTGCARKNDGTLWCWGTNSAGMLGDGTTANSGYAKQVLNLPGSADAVDVGNTETCARIGDQAWCWGTGTNGQLGNGASVNSFVPVRVSGLTGVAQVSVGNAAGCARLTDGSLRCWGLGTSGQRGNNTVVTANTPDVVRGIGGYPRAASPTLPGAPSNLTVTATTGTTATLSWTAPSYDGGSTIYDYLVEYAEVGTNAWKVFPHAAWPATTMTVTGLGPATKYVYRVSAVTAQGTGPSVRTAWGDFTAVGRGSSNTLHTCAIRTGGTVWCWGNNTNYRLGDGTITNSSVPVQVKGLTAPATSVGVGNEHACALLDNGRVQCWGRAPNTQAGWGSVFLSQATAVPGITDATILAVGEYHACVLLAAGGVKCWGYGAEGAMGTGSTNNQIDPGDVTGLSNVVDLTAGGRTTCAVLADATAKCWGYNNAYQLGDGTNTNKTVPTAVTLVTGIRSIALSANHGCAILTDYTVWCWGNNGNSQLGNGTTVSTSSTNLVAVRALNVDNARQLALGTNGSCALLADGSVRCWGLGTSGEVGDGGAAGLTRDTAQVVKGITGATAIGRFGNTSCALIGSAVRCWGLNTSGQAGDGTTTNALEPVPVTSPAALPAVASRVTGLRVASQTDTSVVLQWDPAVGNGLPITGYEVAYTTDQGANWTVFPTGTSTSPTTEITGLAAGQRTAFRVRARTSAGLGRPSFYDAAASVSAGVQTGCVRLWSGGVECWGYNNNFQVGDGTTSHRGLPTGVFAIERASAVANGNTFTCEL